jgi:hypothetical protein
MLVITYRKTPPDVADSTPSPMRWYKKTQVEEKRTGTLETNTAGEGKA